MGRNRVECQLIVQTVGVPVLLAFIGALISLAEMLWNAQAYTKRQLFGGSILGAATSAIAGGIFHFVPNITMPVVIALGCIFGLLGHVYVRNALMKRVDKEL